MEEKTRKISKNPESLKLLNSMSIELVNLLCEKEGWELVINDGKIVAYKH